MNNSKEKYAWIVPLVIVYGGIWFVCHFIIIGFFMPSPGKLYYKLSRIKPRPKKSALDDLTIDRIAMYDMLDDDDE